jgi:hypothetical protein
VALREQARLVTVAALKSVDIASALVPTANNRDWTTTQLRGCLASAKPPLSAVGGSSRLLLILPTGVDQARLREFIETQLGERPEMLPISDGNVIFCYETHGIPLAQAITLIADDRPDYVEAASRLHTRSDVSWLPLLQV